MFQTLVLINMMSWFLRAGYKRVSINVNRRFLNPKNIYLPHYLALQKAGTSDLQDGEAKNTGPLGTRRDTYEESDTIGVWTSRDWQKNQCI